MAGELTRSDAPVVGVLALQGDVREHALILERLGADVVLVRRPADLASVHALVIPGGESSVIDKLTRIFGMQEPLRAAIRDGLPVYGTCAGLILLADRVEGRAPGQEGFGGLDVTVQRNAFGGQVESFETDLVVPVLGEEPVRAVFIRAPSILDVGENVEVLASLVDGTVVAVRQGALLGTSFHPEVDGETRFHELLIASIPAG